MAGGFPSSQDEDLAELSDINVTPFIDVMLVLLIIFMVVAPLSTVDTRIELPASSARQQPRPDKPLYLSMNQDRSLQLGKQPVTLAELAARLDRDSGARRDTRCFSRLTARRAMRM